MIKLLKRIIELLEQPPGDTGRAWDIDDCAYALNCSRNTFINSHSKAPTFPKPYRPMLGDDRRMGPRWKPSEVMDWLYRPENRHIVTRTKSKAA